jgi:hypothetical protein
MHCAFDFILPGEDAQDVQSSLNAPVAGFKVCVARRTSSVVMTDERERIYLRARVLPLVGLIRRPMNVLDITTRRLSIGFEGHCR